MRHDGDDVDPIDVVGNRVLAATRGAYASCQASQQTLRGFVEWKLRDLVSPKLIAKEVTP